MRTCSFYSFERGVGLVDYWHDHNGCFIALTIPLATRVPGKDSRPRCPYCAQLDESKPVSRGPKKPA